MLDRRCLTACDVCLIPVQSMNMHKVRAYIKNAVINKLAAF